jgi:hypothetical protein
LSLSIKDQTTLVGKVKSVLEHTTQTPVCPYQLEGDLKALHKEVISYLTSYNAVVLILQGLERDVAKVKKDISNEISAIDALVRSRIKLPNNEKRTLQDQLQEFDPALLLSNTEVNLPKLEETIQKAISVSTTTIRRSTQARKKAEDAAEALRKAEAALRKANNWSGRHGVSVDASRARRRYTDAEVALSNGDFALVLALSSQVQSQATEAINTAESRVRTLDSEESSRRSSSSSDYSSSSYSSDSGSSSSSSDSSSGSSDSSW